MDLERDSQGPIQDISFKKMPFWAVSPQKQDTSQQIFTKYGFARYIRLVFEI